MGPGEICMYADESVPFAVRVLVHFRGVSLQAKSEHADPQFLHFDFWRTPLYERVCLEQDHLYVRAYS